MKLNKLALATTVALVGTYASQAQAFLPWNPPVPANQVVNFYESGASATAKSVTKLMEEVCRAGSIDTFKDDPNDPAASSGKKWTVIACQLKNAALDTNNVIPSSLYDKYVVMHERFKGGSVWGVVPVNFKWQVEFLNPTAASCTSPTTTGTTHDCTWESDRATGLIAGPDDLECPSSGATTDKSTKCRVTQMGVSDVNPNGFIGPNLPTGWTPLNSGNNILNVTPGFGVVFGISVGEIVYRDLQSKQGLVTYGTGSVADIRTPGSYPTDWSDAKKPNMTKGQINAILKGDVKSWLDIGLDAPSDGYGDMAVCRRVVGSGTQASQNAFFMENPCRTGALGGAEAMVDASKSNGTNYFVVENSGSGDVIDCHNAAYAGSAGYGWSFPTGSIGFNAVEKPASHPGDNWDYVKINGVLPNTANAISGNYDHFFENTLQHRNTLGTASEAGTTLQLAMAQMFEANAGNPRFMNAAGLIGVMSLCTTDGTVGSFPQSSVTKNGDYCGIVTTCP